MGLAYPRAVYEAMTKVPGGNVTKQNAAQQPLYNRAAFNYAVDNGIVNEDDYEEIEEGKYYVRNSNQYFIVKGEWNDENEMIAREPGLYDFYKANESNKEPAIVFYKALGKIYTLKEGKLRDETKKYF